MLETIQSQAPLSHAKKKTSLKQKKEVLNQKGGFYQTHCTPYCWSTLASFWNETRTKDDVGFRTFIGKSWNSTSPPQFATLMHLDHSMKQIMDFFITRRPKNQFVGSTFAQISRSIKTNENWSDRETYCGDKNVTPTPTKTSPTHLPRLWESLLK